MEELLKIENLTYTYGDGTQALKGLNLSIKKGERLAVLGSNGCGKSTLFLCLNGILKPQSGGIFLDEKPFSYDKKSLIEIRKKIGIVFQDPETQLFCVNVWQEVAFAPHNLNYSKERLAQCVEAAMKSVDVENYKEKPPHLLSYGQKKRVSMASVLSVEPQVLVFDEPTSALDPIHSKQIMGLIGGLNDQGKTIVLSTHDVELAFAFADRVVVMGDGKVMKIGTPCEIFEDEALLMQANLDMPLVLRVYKKMVQTGWMQPSKQVPRTILELEQYMEHETIG